MIPTFFTTILVALVSSAVLTAAMPVRRDAYTPLASRYVEPRGLNDFDLQFLVRRRDWPWRKSGSQPKPQAPPKESGGKSEPQSNPKSPSRARQVWQKLRPNWGTKKPEAKAPVPQPPRVPSVHPPPPSQSQYSRPGPIMSPEDINKALDGNPSKTPSKTPPKTPGLPPPPRKRPQNTASPPPNNAPSSASSTKPLPSKRPPSAGPGILDPIEYGYINAFNADYDAKQGSKTGSKRNTFGKPI